MQDEFRKLCQEFPVFAKTKEYLKAERIPSCLGTEEVVPKTLLKASVSVPAVFLLRQIAALG
jgi:hypothetical protein